MTHSQLPPLLLDGWYILHQFFRIEPMGGLASGPDEESERRARAEALRDLFALWEDMGDEGWSGLYRIVGGGTDIMLVHFRRDLEALGDAERAVRRSPAGEDLVLTGDYLSVVELGMYALTQKLFSQAADEGIAPGTEEWKARVEAALEKERGKNYVKERLQPTQPDNMPYVCFYPMDKRRTPGQNWYTLPLSERARMMAEHGRTGRTYAGRISQVISGSIGLDDWEWAVTLFAPDPLDFKALVTEMRYDEASSEFAEFGSFWVGYRIPVGEIPAELAGGA